MHPSRFLFAVAVEPLAEACRSGEWFEGILFRGRQHYVSLYVDDILLYICNAHRNMPRILTLLDEFGALSGLRVNWSKTSAFWIVARHPWETLDVRLSSLTWEPETFRHLGVNIYRKSTDIMEGNVKPAIRILKRDIEFWRVLLLSAIGRVALSKMVSLPRLLYFFATLPVVID